MIEYKKGPSKKALEQFHREFAKTINKDKGEKFPLENQVRWVCDRYLGVTGTTIEHPVLALKNKNGIFTSAQGTTFRKEKINHLFKKGLMSSKFGQFKVFKEEKPKDVSQGKLDRDVLFFLHTENIPSKKQFLKGRYICNVEQCSYCLQNVKDLLLASERRM